jgi:hypothetical protein
MKKLTVILKLFPVILSAVQAVEEAIPIPGQGRKKLDLVLDVLKQAFDASSDLSQSFSWENLVAVVVPMIAKIVDLHNELGLFAKPTLSKA